MNDPYVLGTSVEVAADYHQPNGDLFDPDTVVLKIRAPDKSERTYTYGVDAIIVRDVAGKYHAWLLPDQTGEWFYRWKGTATRSVAAEGSFLVAASAFDSP